MGSLSGARVLVIGGSSGIGLGVAKAALAEGARVTIASSNPAKLERALDRLGGGEAVRLDVTDEAAVRSHFESCSGLEHIVFTAADWDQVDHTDISRLDITASRSLFEVRFWGAIAVAKYAAPYITPGGSITLTNGMAGHRPQKGLMISTAMSGAVEHLVKGLAFDLAPDVRVNGICPGAIRTEAWDELPPDFRAFQEARLSLQPLPRVGEIQETAEAYLYLMRGTYTTGQTLRVEGGWSLAG